MTRATGSLIGYWDRQAATYDRKTAGIERRLLSQSRRWVGTRARGATLEIGVGTGANLPHYPDDVDLTAVDWSTAMLDAARAQAARVHRPVTLRQADGAALPFPAGTFDTVLATFVLCCVPDERSVLAEALRVLKPGGRLLLADHVAASSWPLRLVQHAVDLVSVPLHGEHYTRRPFITLNELGVTVVEHERVTKGVIERVHASPRTCSTASRVGSM